MDPRTDRDLYGIAWSKLNAAHRQGRADDSARRALGMAPIVLTDERIERLELAARVRIAKLNGAA